MQITYSCGHQIEMKAVKNKKAEAAKKCPACTYHEAQAAKHLPSTTLYCVPRMYESGSSVFIIADEDNAVAKAISNRVTEFRSDHAPASATYRSFESREAAERHVKELVRREHITLEIGETLEKAVALNRQMLAMKDEDERESRRRTDDALAKPNAGPPFDPYAEDADEAIFGVH